MVAEAAEKGTARGQLWLHRRKEGIKLGAFSRRSPSYSDYSYSESRSQETQYGRTVSSGCEVQDLGNGSV